MPHKSEDFKISAVEYYLDSNKTQEEVCDIFKCSVRSLMRMMIILRDIIEKQYHIKLRKLMLNLF
jgi:hypothetical protein